MGAVKQAFETIGNGIKDIGEGIANVAVGLGHTVEGALTANPDELKAGLNGMKDGVEGSIKGVGEVAGGAAAAVIDVTPVGAAMNALTNNGVNTFVEGAANSIASTFSNGVEGAKDFVEGLAHGDFKEAAMGALNVGLAVAAVIPGEGEAVMAGEAIGKVAVTEGVELGAKKAAGEAIEAGVETTTSSGVRGVVKENVEGGVQDQALSTVTGQNSQQGPGAPAAAQADATQFSGPLVPPGSDTGMVFGSPMQDLGMQNPFASSDDSDNDDEDRDR